MKRRASQQLLSGSQNQAKSLENFENNENSENREKNLKNLESSENDSETCPSERKKFKAKRNTAKEEKPEQPSESFLKLLADLRDPDCVQKTNERIAKLEEDNIENSTPRKIIPNEQKDFLKLKSFHLKLRLKDANLGRGELQVIKSTGKETFLIVFRNCIQKVLFSGMVFKLTKAEVLNSQCKEKHSQKIDLEVTVLKQPEGKFCRVVFCGQEELVKELEKELKGIVNKICQAEEVKNEKGQ